MSDATYVAGETVEVGDTIVFLGIRCLVERIEPYDNPESAGFPSQTRRAYLSDGDTTMTLPLQPQGGVWVAGR